MGDKYVKLNDIIDTLGNEWGYEGMHEDLQSLPTADVVEVVRCKDCKYWECVCVGTTGRCESPRNGLFYDYTDNFDFCSYGERKGGGTDA